MPGLSGVAQSGLVGSFLVCFFGRLVFFFTDSVTKKFHMVPVLELQMLHSVL